MRKRSGYFMAILMMLLIFLLSTFTNIINFIVDYRWFKELGYTKTFLTKLTTQLQVGIPAFIVLFLFLMLYLMTLKKKYYKQAKVQSDKKSEKRLNTVLGFVSALISLFIASLFSSNLWFTLLQYVNSTDFNIKDPVFNNDLSFYIFKLPLIREIVGLILLLAFMVAVLTIGFYFIMLTMRPPAPDMHDNVFELNSHDPKKVVEGLLNKKILNHAILQIGILGLVVFMVLAINYLLRSFDLLYSARGVAYGASYTDVHISLWVYRVMAVMAILGAVTILLGTTKRNLKLALTGPVLLIATAIIGNIISGGVQQFVVEPNEIAKEQKYLQYNIDFTQKAYGLDEVVEKEFPVSQNLTKEDLAENDEIIKNIRINDYRPIEKVYNQLQGIRPYYRFTDIDIDRYTIDGKYTQVFLSGRELDQQKLQTKTWINQHLKYTHGYGFALSPVNSVSSNGQPELLVKSIPPQTKTDLKIERPEIYFGEIGKEYIIVKTDEKEFDYPQGSNNSETIYEGTAGIELNGFFDKLLFAIKQGSFKILLSGDINDQSKILINRNIEDRIKKIAPFIQYDGDPYLVVNQEDGKLYWIIDGYTLSERYPYSQPYSEENNINYIRNSVKVVVDAYDGTTNYYVYDDEDPIIKTYEKIFPGLFLSREDMPKGIKEHTRYPQLLFNIQSRVYRRYHVNNTRVFYNSEDIWDIAQEKYMDAQQQNIESNYVMFRLPEEEDVEFLLTLPYTPATKPNMTSLFVARNDGENYGELVTYKFPKGETIDGPMMIESRIDQNTDISQLLTLWSQEGSKVLRGNLIVVPIENSLLYVEPIYLEADNENSLPEMKRVIVAYGEDIVMEQTLDAALTKIFGKVRVEKDDNGVVEDMDVGDQPEGFNNLIQRANEVYLQAKQAAQSGNWSDYGKYMEELQDLLNNLNQLDGKAELEVEAQ